MSSFDNHWEAASEAFAAEMGEEMLVHDSHLVAVSTPVTSRDRYDPAAGGRVKEQMFTVFLTRNDALAVVPLKGQLVTLKRNNLTGRIMAVSDLGGAGICLDCQPLNQRKVS